MLREGGNGIGGEGRWLFRKRLVAWRISKALEREHAPD